MSPGLLKLAALLLDQQGERLGSRGNEAELTLLARDDEIGDSFLERFSALPSHEGDYVALLNENNPEGAVGLFSANGVPRVIMPRDAYEKFVAEFGPREPPRVLVLDAPNAKDNGVYDVGEDGKLSRPWFSAEDIARMRTPRVPVPGEPEPRIVVGVDPATGSSVTVADFADGTREIRDVTMIAAHVAGMMAQGRDMPEEYRPKMLGPTFDGMPFPEVPIELLRPNQANPRKIDRILPAAETMNRAIVAGHMRLGAFQNEQLQVDEKIADLMARLDRLAKTIPRLAPTVEALLWRAANSDDTFGDLAVGYRRIQAGDEIVNGEWVRPSFGLKSAEDVRKIFDAIAHQAKTGAAEMRDLGEKLEADGKVRLQRKEPAPVRPNRHERRKQAAIARTARR